MTCLSKPSRFVAVIRNQLISLPSRFRLGFPSRFVAVTRKSLIFRNVAVPSWSVVQTPHTPQYPKGDLWGKDPLGESDLFRTLRSFSSTAPTSCHYP